MKANKIIDWAYKQIGTKESPAGSNSVIYNADYYGKPVADTAKAKYPWCVTFLWDGFRICGGSPLFYGGGKTASCTSLYNFHKKAKQIVTEPKRGDLVIYKFNSSKPQHIGIVYEVNGDTIKSIEGNTSNGNDCNGGAVMLRTRNKKEVYAFIRPAYEAESNTKVVHTNQICSIWSAPATLDKNRTKYVPKDYEITVSPEVVKSTIGDGKTFFKTVKGAYVLCKCVV